MPNNGKFYQKRPAGKRKIAVLQIFSDIFYRFRSSHFVCPGVMDACSKWAAGVQYPLYACRFVIHAALTCRIVSHWAGASAPALFLCSPFQGGCLTSQIDVRPIIYKPDNGGRLFSRQTPFGRPPIYFTNFAEQDRATQGCDPSGSARRRQGRGVIFDGMLRSPPFSFNVNNGFLR